jgi:MFS family permease
VFFPFMLEGVLMSVLSFFLTDIERNLKLTDSQLGTAVLCIYVGMVLVSPATAYGIRVFGSQSTTFTGSLGFAVMYSFIPKAHMLNTLMAVMFVYGAFMGLMDISMNSHAILTEVVAGKPLLGTFHASYSIAAAFGSLIGGALTQSTLGIDGVFQVVSFISIVLAFASGSNMYSFAQEKVITQILKNVSSDAQNSTKPTVGSKRGTSDVELEDVESSDGSLSFSEAPDSRNLDKIITFGANKVAKRPHRSTLSEVTSEDSGMTNAFIKGFSMEGYDNGRSQSGKGGKNGSSTGAAAGGAGTSGADSAKGTSSADASNNSSSSNNSNNNSNNGSSNWLTVACYSAVGFLAAFGESGLLTWCVAYFERYLSATPHSKSLGFTVFMVCMACGRFSCDYLRGRYGRRITVRVGGVCASLGLLGIVASPELPGDIAWAVASCALTGIGLSTIIPTMFSSAGHIPGAAHAGTSIAIVSMFTNSGCLASSPLIGFVSDAAGSMRVALFWDALLVACIVPLSLGIPEEEQAFLKAKPAPGAEASQSGDKLF